MKCGKDTKSNRVFCEDCLAVMDRYPIAPGTPVKLPRRSEAPKKAPVRKKNLSPEEQILRLQKIIGGMGLTILTLALALVLSITLLVHNLNADSQPENIGQNYNTSDNTDGN